MNLTVHTERLLYDEQGFLALRFHPKYSENGLFYAWYTVLKVGEELERTSRLSEFRVCALSLRNYFLLDYMNTWFGTM